MKPGLLLLWILGYTSSPAQDPNFVTIKAGNMITDVLPAAEVFFYPQFTKGKVHFRDGSKSIGVMNYSRLLDQMLFIDPNGDTLAVADEKTIKFISILQDTFYFDEGYVRTFATNKVVKLAEKQVWALADTRKMGTHNQAKSTVAITTISLYTDGTDAAKSQNLVINEDLILRKTTYYYFGDENNHFVRTGKKKLFSLFLKDELRIDAYLKENNINFDNKADLEKLAQFLAQLH
jgi:hypothetical protein